MILSILDHLLHTQTHDLEVDHQRNVCRVFVIRIKLSKAGLNLKRFTLVDYKPASNV